MADNWNGKCDICGKETNFFYAVIKDRKIKQVCYSCYIKYVKVKNNEVENSRKG